MSAVEAPWPGGAAETVGAPPDSDPDWLDDRLRASASHAVDTGREAVEADPWRQAFHVQPPVGLLNDPNGLVQHEGTYHLCYQWHPFAPTHGLKFWAHLTSTDLVNWAEQPVALAPSHPYESHGCYSGSGIVHDGSVRFLYTGNVRTPNGGRTPFQLLATLGADGTVTKHPANPLIAAIPGCGAHVRDPKVWTRDGVHWMILGAQTDDLRGTALLLRSTDLIEWEYLGQLAGGAGGPSGYMWECPDLVRIDGRDALVISPQLDHGPTAGSGRWEDMSLYAVGDLDVDAPAFTPHGHFRRVDAGPDFYAPQTLTDEAGRTIMIGWMGMPDHEGQPPLADKHPTVANGWVHCLTVPRVLSLDGDHLVQMPVPELAALHGTGVTHAGLTIEPGPSPVVLDDVVGPALDVELAVDVSPGAAVLVRLREGSGRPVIVTLDPTRGTAALDRTLLGTGEGGVATGTFRAGPRVEARILLDHSSIELFVDGGWLAMSARIYPDPTDNAVSIEALGGSARVDLACHTIGPG